MCFVALMGPFLTGLSQAQMDPVCRPCALDREGGRGNWASMWSKKLNPASSRVAGSCV